MNLKNIPRHVVIIPDGNRRWAKAKGFDSCRGYYEGGGYEKITDLFNCAKELGIRYLSFWGFSTDNWKRSPAERKAIFDTILKGVERFRKDAEKEEIRFRHIGRKERIPEKLALELEKLEKETAKYAKFNVMLCLDYGGRDELIRAVNKILESGEKEIDEESFKDYLDTKDFPDPDLIIRTGEKRLSGFMPYQSVYSELYFTEIYYPDFDSKELKKAVTDFSERKRRFGGN